MKPNSKVDNKRTLLLNTLTDMAFHSGQALGEALGVSRMAVSKHIHALQDLGVEIFSVKGKGYRLGKPLQLLNKDKIRELSGTDVELEVLNVIGSTNDYVKSKGVTSPNGFTCLAEAQTSGRGRLGRKWISPFGSSIYLSMFWSFANGYQSVTGLSLAVGVAINRALKEMAVVDCQLKWPNDIYLGGKKLAGVLIEIEGQPDALCHSIIGIGLNISLPENVQGIDQPWADLSQGELKQVERNSLCATLIRHLHRMLLEFEQQGLEPFVGEWMAADVFANKSVKLLMGENVVEGIARGINKFGALQLEIDDKVKSFYGGEISVRSQ